MKKSVLEVILPSLIVFAAIVTFLAFYFNGGISARVVDFNNPVSINSLGNSYSSPAYYILTKDLTGSVPGITFNSGASGSILDCKGFSIDGGGGATARGIYLTDVTGMTIKNCKIYNFENGIYLSSSSGNYILNNIVKNNQKYGIVLFGISSTGNTLKGNVFSNNLYSGIFLDKGSSNTFMENTANNNGRSGLVTYGLSSASINNRIENNSFCYNNQATNLGDIRIYSQQIVSSLGNICDSCRQEGGAWGICYPNITGASKCKYDCSYYHPSCESYLYGEWGICGADGAQTRELVEKFPGNCQGGAVPELTRACTPLCAEINWKSTLIPEACPQTGKQARIWTKIGNCEGGVTKQTDEVSCSPAIANCLYFYTNWSECSVSGVQIRAKMSESPAGCQGVPELIRVCNQCMESNWTFIDSPAICPESGKQTRRWTKIADCSGGIFHNATEEIGCNYQQVSCVPNLLNFTTPCVNEKQVTYFVENGTACGGLPANISKGCDANRNGLAGKFEEIERNMNLTFYVNGIVANSSKIFSSVLDFEFSEGSKPRVKFSHDFGEGILDLTKIKIEKQGSNDKLGYLVINGLNAEKSVVVDRLNASSNAVCIEDIENARIEEVSLNCNGENEIIVVCNGSVQSSYRCIMSNVIFEVSGIVNSVIKEFIANVSLGSATGSSWANATASRATDASATPSVQPTVPSFPAATPVSETEPSDEEEEEKPDLSLAWIGLVVLIAAVLVAIIIAYFARKKKGRFLEEKRLKKEISGESVRKLKEDEMQTIMQKVKKIGFGQI